MSKLLVCTHFVVVPFFWFAFLSINRHPALPPSLPPSLPLSLNPSLLPSFPLLTSSLPGPAAEHKSSSLPPSLPLPLKMEEEEEDEGALHA